MTNLVGKDQLGGDGRLENKQPEAVEVFSGETKKDGLIRRLERYIAGYNLLNVLRTAKETNSSAGIVQKLKDDGIEPRNVNAIFNTIQEQDWSNIFSELKEGDEVAMLLAPGANFLSIKELNNIFGEAGADAIRDERNSFIESLSVKLGYKVLYLDFSRIILKNVSELGTDKFEENLEELCKKVDEHISGFITTMGNAVREEIADEKKKIAINILLEKLEHSDITKGGYQMTFGIDAIIKSEKSNLREIVLSVDHCLQLGQWARENFSNQDSEDKIEHGDIYNVDLIKNFFGEIENSRLALIDTSNDMSRLIKIDGISFEVFEDVGDGNLQLNKNVLHAYRKGRINPEGQEEAFNLLNVYLKRLNFFDFMKPYLNEEIDEGLRTGFILQTNAVDIFDKYMTEDGELNQDNLELLIRMLEADPKDRNCSSRYVFYGECLEKDGFFVKFDAVDVWVAQMQYFEELSQEIGSDDINSEDNVTKILGATDVITRKLREIRKIIRDEIGSLNMEVGGDEALVFVETNDFSADLIIKIQEKCLRETGFNLRAVVVEKSGENALSVAGDILNIDTGIDVSKRIEDRQRNKMGKTKPFFIKVNSGSYEIIPK